MSLFGKTLWGIALKGGMPLRFDRIAVCVWHYIAVCALCPQAHSTCTKSPGPRCEIDTQAA
jgi:hypothetical protein